MTETRERRLQPGEWERLEEACRQRRSPYLLLMVELAVETAMRRGELLNARWSDVKHARRTLFIPITKNGHARTIPLTGRAVAVLERLKELNEGGERVIPLTDGRHEDGLEAGSETRKAGRLAFS